MIELHAFNTPNGRKISVALEEMGLSYKVRVVDITKDQQFDPAFLAISPNNKIPAIVDPDGPNGAPISVFESGAILLYLGEKTGQFLPGNAMGGRPKGSRNLLAEDFLADLHADWKVGGKGAIQRVRDEKPDQYLKVVASTLPKELNVKVSELDDLDDDQLRGQLARVVAQLAAAGVDLVSGTGAAEAPQPAAGVSALH